MAITFSKFGCNYDGSNLRYTESVSFESIYATIQDEVKKIEKLGFPVANIEEILRPIIHTIETREDADAIVMPISEHISMEIQKELAVKRAEESVTDLPSRTKSAPAKFESEESAPPYRVRSTSAKFEHTSAGPSWAAAVMLKIFSESMPGQVITWMVNNFILIVVMKMIFEKVSGVSAEDEGPYAAILCGFLQHNACILLEKGLEVIYADDRYSRSKQYTTRKALTRAFVWTMPRVVGEGLVQRVIDANTFFQYCNAFSITGITFEKLLKIAGTDAQAATVGPWLKWAGFNSPKADLFPSQCLYFGYTAALYGNAHVQNWLHKTKFVENTLFKNSQVYHTWVLTKLALMTFLIVEAMEPLYRRGEFTAQAFVPTAHEDFYKTLLQPGQQATRAFEGRDGSTWEAFVSACDPSKKLKGVVDYEKTGKEIIRVVNGFAKGGIDVTGNTLTFRGGEEDPTFTRIELSKELPTQLEDTVEGVVGLLSRSFTYDADLKPKFIPSPANKLFDLKDGSMYWVAAGAATSYVAFVLYKYGSDRTERYKPLGEGQTLFFRVNQVAKIFTFAYGAPFFAAAAMDPMFKTMELNYVTESGPPQTLSDARSFFFVAMWARRLLTFMVTQHVLFKFLRRYGDEEGDLVSPASTKQVKILEKTYGNSWMTFAFWVFQCIPVFSLYVGPLNQANMLYQGINQSASFRDRTTSSK